MSDNHPRVAVLLAAYNGMAWIEQQVASILAQTGVVVTIYISIDPSSDGTEAWCNEYAISHPTIHVLPPSVRFGGAAPNFFRLIRDVDLSAYDYVSFSDQDDIWCPNKLERATMTLRVGGFDGYSSNVFAFWPDGRRMLVDKAQPQVQWDHFFEAAGPGCTYVVTQRLAVAFKRLIEERWLQVQEVALHDWLCYAFARNAGFQWFIDPVAWMDYRQHSCNQVGVNAGLGSAVKRVSKVFHGWWFSQVRLICELTAKNADGGQVKRPELYGRLAMIRLMIQSRKCRRRPRDQLVFAALCILLVFRQR
ncbi:glycosyltransferase [Pseudomonas putida]|uniref:glycosyltransferase n=1 Tax=Pseudomonas putida TaxID=303 RepID=UPI000BEFB985|nr:glycosyltransferase [Pseudomonas putida]MDD2024032.1 glycosyltransferase [Pseudomonas putida]PEI06848.1 glycosyl transferase [Pseudomonas putida]